MLTKEEKLERKKIRRQLVIEEERKRARELSKKMHKEAKTGFKQFKREFKKEMNTAVMAAFGFLIALVWKDVITNFVENLSERSPFKGALVSALMVTVICVLGIMLFSRVLKNNGEDNKKR